MSYIIWGVGRRGNSIYDYFKGEVIAFIDSDERKIGKYIDGLPIISFDDYLNYHKNKTIIVSPFCDDEIITKLHENNITDFLRSNDCPRCFVDNYYFADNYYPEVFQKFINLVGRKRVILIGKNIYSVWLFKQFINLGYNIELVPVEQLKNLQRGKNDCLLVAAGEDNEVIEDGILSGEMHDIFYLGNLLPDCYRNTELNELKELYKNQRCFIIATGPSLLIKDLDRLYEAKEICISMNKIFYCFNDTMWRPDYYVGEDDHLLKYYKDDIRKIAATKILSDNYEYIPEKGEKCYKYHIYFPEPELTGFRYGSNDDFTYGYPCGYSVIFGCIYLAIYMGFKEIYLLGADMNYVGNAYDKANHFYGEKDEISQKNSGVSPPFLTDVVQKNYKHVFKYAKKRNVNIYNATRGGRLEEFPRVNFEDIV